MIAVLQDKFSEEVIAEIELPKNHIQIDVVIYRGMLYHLFVTQEPSKTTEEEDKVRQVFVKSKVFNHSTR